MAAPPSVAELRQMHAEAKTKREAAPQPGPDEGAGGAGGAGPRPAAKLTPQEAAATQESLEVLGVGGALPPLAGGTSFGAEFASVERTRWQSRQQFVLVLMGYCIGVGNLWRFPYLCGRYGGGAFLVAYVIMLFTVAAPLFFYETVLGQKFQRGPAATFRKMAPRWRGLAYIPVVMTLFYLPYYQIIVAYSFHYLVASFQSPLPWVDNTTPDKYLDTVVLHRTESLGAEGSGQIHGQLLWETAAVWVITALCLVKGIHSAGKAAYVTVILPFIMMFLLFLVTIRLDGAAEGLRYYLTPRFEALLNPEVWGLAAGQIIFSLSPGTGTCISLASYHDKDYKGLLTDCIFIATTNSLFSLFGGFVVFAVVGNLALTEGRPIEEVAASGEGLAFIVFAKGLAEAGAGEWSGFFSALFFLTLFLLGLDSTFAVVETLQTYINDYIISRNPSQKISVAGNTLRLVLICTTLLLIGLPYVTRGGYFLLEIADHFVVTYALVVGVFLEYIMIGHVYTAERMLEDVKESTGVTLPSWCLTQIKYVAPINLGFVIVLLLISEVTGDSMSGYPAGAVAFFGVLPVVAALSSFFLPAVQFRLRRLFYSHIYPKMTSWTPEGLAAARQRARGSGFKDPDILEAHAGGGGSSNVAAYSAGPQPATVGRPVYSDAAPLSMHRER